MKKLLTLAIAAIAMATTTNAQIVSSRSQLVTTTTEVKPSTTTWLVRAGLNIMNFTGDDAKEFDSKVGYDVAFSFQKSLGSVDGLYWGMEFGLGSRGWHYEDGSDETYSQLAHNFRWSPFTIGYKYAITDAFKVEAHLGAFASVDYAGKIKWTYGDYDGDIKIGDWDEFYYDDWNRFDAGLQLGFGVWYDRYNLDFTWQRGFIEGVKDYKMYTSNFMIRLGVAF